MKNEFRVLWGGADITEDIEISLLNVTEDCGDTPDSIELVVADADDQWSQWRPQKGDTLEITHRGYSSEQMEIDEIRQDRGQMMIGALSAPAARKTPRTKAWENTTLVTIAGEIAACYGLSPRFYGAPSYSYVRVDQMEQRDFAFLAERCALEGCTMKISGKQLIVYLDKQMEAAAPVKTITQAMLYDEPKFTVASEACAGCTVVCGEIAGTFEDPAAGGGSLLTVGKYEVASAGEARRFAQNLCRGKNKREMTGRFTTALDTTITACNTVTLRGVGLADGAYFIEDACHRFADGVSEFRVRRVFTRY